MRPRPTLAAALVAAAAAAVLPRGAAAQSPQPPIEACTYQECALRAEPASIFFGARTLYRGATGVQVARFGFAGPRLEEIVRGSDSAVANARRFQPVRRRAGIAGAVSFALGVAAVVASQSDGGNDAAVAASVAGSVVGVYAGFEARRAERWLSRSLWWYNQAVAGR
jgi:hypothetical protein